jgi:hypothetical protein
VSAGRIPGSEAAPILGAVLERFPKGHDSSALGTSRTLPRPVLTVALSARRDDDLFGSSKRTEHAQSTLSSVAFQSPTRRSMTSTSTNRTALRNFGQQVPNQATHPALAQNAVSDLPLLGTQAVEIDDDDDQNAGDNSLPKCIYVEQIGAVVDGRQDERAQEGTMHRADRAKEAGAADH